MEAENTGIERVGWKKRHPTTAQTGRGSEFERRDLLARRVQG